MYEYVSFNPYNSSPEALAVELTKKSADGWEVVNGEEGESERVSG